MAGKGSAPGERRGGRRKGSRNKNSLAIEHRGNPMVLLSSTRVQQILEGKMPCSVCRGKGKTKFQPASHRNADGEFVLRDLKDTKCRSCYGSGFEQLDPALIGKVAIAVRGEAYPQLKAVEHSN